MAFTKVAVGAAVIHLGAVFSVVEVASAGLGVCV